MVEIRACEGGEGGTCWDRGKLLMIPGVSNPEHYFCLKHRDEVLEVIQDWFDDGMPVDRTPELVK